MSLVVIVNVYSFTEIALVYRRSFQNRSFKTRHVEILRFVVPVMSLVFAQIASLSIWAIALILFDFVTDWMTAVLLTASFFTTVGNFTVNFPEGWRLLPSIVAFSGLFSFAWATASSMTMVRSLTDYLDKHKQA